MVASVSHSQLVPHVAVQPGCVLRKQSSDIAPRQDMHWLDGEALFEYCLCRMQLAWTMINGTSWLCA